MKTAAAMLGVAMALFPAIAMAQKPSAYPSKDQSAEQQHKDDAECLDWAKRETGVDPAAAPPPPASGPQGERLRGAVRGAAGGAVIGEIVDGDSSKGAGVGAAAGVLAGGAQARRNREAQAQKAEAAKEQQAGTYYRAYGACMQARGYTVN